MEREKKIVLTELMLFYQLCADNPTALTSEPFDIEYFTCDIMKNSLQTYSMTGCFTFQFICQVLLIMSLSFPSQNSFGRTMQDPVYNQIRTSLETYHKAASWNEPAYNLICVKINNAKKNQRINTSQQKELLDLAQQEYVRSLNDAASSYLRTAGANAMAQLTAFEKAIQRISVGNGSTASALSEVNNSISAFRRMIGLRSALLAYSRRVEYSATRTSSFKSQMNQLVSGSLLSNNAFLSKLRVEYTNELNTHLAKHTYFYEVVKPDAERGESPNCEVFSLYRFYYDACLQEQQKIINSSTQVSPVDTIPIKK